MRAVKKCYVCQGTQLVRTQSHKGLLTKCRWRPNGKASSYVKPYLTGPQMLVLEQVMLIMLPLFLCLRNPEKQD